MDEQKIKDIFEKAAKVVEGLPDVLKPKAFEIAVSELSSADGISGKTQDPSHNLGTSRKTKVPNQKIDEKTKKKKVSGLKAQILDLINGGYFDDDKTSQVLMQDFRKKAFTYTNSAVSMTLMLLVRNNVLSRSGSGTQKDPWRYKKA